MSPKSARIDSPDVIKRFRNDFILFDSACQQAVEGVRADVTRTIGWLKGEQLSYWKQQIRKRDELVLRAKAAYQRVRFASNASGLDEKRALQKAIRRKEEAEEKLKRVKKWAQVIERKSGPMLGPVLRLSNELADMTPRAVVRLDRMVDSLDAYFRAAAAEAGGSPAGEE
jgi:hypothetical protein